ncbi:unnamed protein product [Schistosoma turkestanicum]|nr:unnamed protein product [Schistosoma turkestanicum]
MSDCFFTSTLPDYVLDRKIIINNNHVHYVNGYKLVKASELFKRQLIKLRRRELACYQHRRKILAVSKYRLCRAKMKNLSYPKCQPLLLNYPDIPALECLLSFIHCDEETRNTMLSDYIQPTTINSLLEVGLYFQTFDFINQCLHIIALTNRNAYLTMRVSRFLDWFASP